MLCIVEWSVPSGNTGRPPMGVLQESAVRLNASRTLLFARNFFKFPTMLGSLIPSSPFLVNDLLSQVDFDRARVVVEYGPGVGTFTQEILKRMRPDAALVAIELNEEFAGFLKDEIGDRRLHAVHASACDVGKVLASLNLPSADYIISGIPFSTMPKSLRAEIMRNSREALRPDGALLVYQFTRAVRPYLESSFGSVQENFQMLNILPARIFYCTP
jgi:phospholipid N-methyltransferase